MGKTADGKIQSEFLKWYYNSDVWKSTTYMGVPAKKSVADMWNYQEIIYGLCPSLIIEFGTNEGGGALFFSHLLKEINPGGIVLTVDIDGGMINRKITEQPNIKILLASSVSGETEKTIGALTEKYAGPIFAILDSDHSMEHVLKEMELLARYLKKDDYLVVEDGIVNGNPVLQGWGKGPLEAIEEYFRKYPGHFARDTARERKFGFTFAPHGYLIRK